MTCIYHQSGKDVNMLVKKFNAGTEEAPIRLCWIEVAPTEAADLIASLSKQVGSSDSNTDRLESHCSGEFDELSIVVKTEKPTPSLADKLHGILSHKGR